MVKTLTKHGNSLALVIDKPILDLLGVTGDTELKITTDGRRLIIDPQGAPEGHPQQDEASEGAAGAADPTGFDRPAKFREAMDKVNARYGRMLKRLAE